MEVHEAAAAYVLAQILSVRMPDDWADTDEAAAVRIARIYKVPIERLRECLIVEQVKRKLVK